MATEQTPPARGFFSRLGRGLTAFLVVDVVLVAVFAVLLVDALRGREGAEEPPAPTPSAAEESPEETPAAGSEDVGALTTFVLPSGNIHCSMTEVSATCTILQFQFEPPEAPDGCDGTVGSTLTVEAGEAARFDCDEGDPPPVPDDATELDYGEQSTVGEMTCASSENGVLCRHNPSGQGFSVARAGYIIF